jgi:hypothetical protein
MEIFNINVIKSKNLITLIIELNNIFNLNNISKLIL